MKKNQTNQNPEDLRQCTRDKSSGENNNIILWADKPPLCESPSHLRPALLWFGPPGLQGRCTGSCHHRQVVYTSRNRNSSSSNSSSTWTMYSTEPDPAGINRKDRTSFKTTISHMAANSAFSTSKLFQTQIMNNLGRFVELIVLACLGLMDVWELKVDRLICADRTFYKASISVEFGSDSGRWLCRLQSIFREKLVKKKKKSLPPSFYI